MTNVRQIIADQFLTNSKGIVTLIGSTRFHDEYQAANRLLTLSGWIVLSCGHFGHSIHKHLDQESVNEQAKLLHFVKIRKSDAVCLVNSSYIGKSTQNELEYAMKLKKPLLEFVVNMTHSEPFRSTYTGHFELEEYDYAKQIGNHFDILDHDMIFRRLVASWGGKCY